MRSEYPATSCSFSYRSAQREVATGCSESFSPANDAAQTSSAKHPCGLLQPNAIDVVPLRHIGQDDFVADVQARQNFHGVDRVAAQLDVDALGVGIVRHDFEEADRRIGLTVHRPADIQNVFQVLEGDRAVHAEVGARAERKRVVDADIHGDRAVDDRGIDADHVAIYDTVARIDGRALTDDDVLRLCFRNLDFSFQFFWIGDARDVCANGYALTNIDREQLQHAGDARANMQRVGLALAQFEHGACLFEVGLLRLDARLGGVCGDACALFLQPDADLELFRAYFRESFVFLGAETLLLQLV